MASPFTSKDGSRFTNRSTMMQHEARTASKGPAISKQAAPADDGEYGEQGQGESQDGAAMAAEHGPATELDIQHDHEAGRHTVHATHPDGHAHDSEHASASEAHKYAADCAGCGDGGSMAMAGGE